MFYQVRQIRHFKVLALPTLLLTGLLTGCTDLMMDDTAAMNQHYGYYTQHSYVRPQPVRRVQSNVQSNQYYQASQYNHYYQAPRPVYYQAAPQPAPQVQHYPVYQAAAPAPAQVHHNAQQAQIASDRAMAQRLQNEEYARAHREVEQIASDRALAERLQAEEFAR